jgi:hypothetical protein
VESVVQTGISAEDIDTNFERAIVAALHLAAQKDAARLPGYTGKISCKWADFNSRL